MTADPRTRKGHVQLMLGEELHGTVKALAEQDHRTLSNFIEWVLIRYINERALERGPK